MTRLQRPRPVGRVVAEVAEQRPRGVGELDLDAALGHAAPIRRATCRSTISASWSRLSASNSTMSSSRLMNSGLKLISTPARPPGMLEVMTSTAFLKSTVRPWPSVRRPSSMTCSRTLKTSAWAFSISSSRTTEYGRRRTASVSWPPSS